ncbi:MAG: LacI family DNA-binding transcriptional regulator [Clostridiales bacterium]|nr:LacI family DNA-binding transcriptional regulator [Clostridiales bacterium]
MASIRDVSKRAGVSIATVSNALNGQPNISEATREKVLKAVQELGYFPNINARLMKTAKTNAIAVFYPNFNASFYTGMLQSMYGACRENGYDMFVYISKADTSRKLVASILSSNFDGAVILHEKLAEEDLPLLAQRKVPYVFMDKEVPGKLMSGVLINNFKGIMQGLEYLKHTGHTRIAFMGGTGNYDSVMRHDAFMRGMKKLRLPIDPDYMFQGYFQEDAAYSIIRGSATGGRFANDKARPDAVFCANDVMAKGVVRALCDIGLNVPRDISVLGFDDNEYALQCAPPLATIRYSLEDMGRQAVLEVLRLMKPKAQGKLLYIDTKLVVRESVSIRYEGEL